MQDDLTTSLPAARRGTSGRTIAATFAAALLLGAAATAWVSWHYGWLNVDLPWAEKPAPAQPLADTAPPPPAALPADSLAKISALETRIAELDREAAAASGNATRAEGLLIAFAARRAIERGQPLGYLEGQLRQRFGASQPQAVDRVINAANQPVTLDSLSEELAALEPSLTTKVPNEGTWDWLGRQVGELFIIRHADAPSPAPAQRLARVKLYLAGGRVDQAMDEVARLPGHDAAKDWLAHARAYVDTRGALDALENTAILTPQPVPAAVVAPVAQQPTTSNTP